MRSVEPINLTEKHHQESDCVVDDVVDLLVTDYVVGYEQVVDCRVRGIINLSVEKSNSNFKEIISPKHIKVNYLLHYSAIVGRNCAEVYLILEVLCSDVEIQVVFRVSMVHDSDLLVKDTGLLEMVIVDSIGENVGINLLALSF